MSTSEISKTIKRFLKLSIRLSYRSVCNHPILIGFSLFLLFLYRFFPSLFFSLISASPVLICTTLLLGTILSFGQPNIPQIEEEEEEEEEEKQQQEEREKTINSDQILSFSATAGQNSNKKPEINITERELEEVSFTEQLVNFSPENDALSKEIIQDKESVLSLDERSRSFSIEREVGESSLAFLNNAALDEPVDSPQWQRIANDSHDDDDASSGFESDGAESSSPDASMTDIIPLLDEIDPLLDSDVSPRETQEDLQDDSDSSSQASSHDLLQIESAEDDGEEEDDKSAVKGDAETRETAFTWTADDQKNLMDLGYSEAERNRRLENLMARRRSRKNIRFELDQDLINLNGNTKGSIDDLSQFRIHVPPVSAPRENPFDSSFGSDVPGSAPSVLAPRRNPFDDPYEEPTESMVLPRESWSPRQYMSASHRDVFYTRHDSFNYSGGEFGQGRRASRFKPFLVSDSYTDTLGEASSSSIKDPILESNSGRRDEEEENRDEGSLLSSSDDDDDDDISSIAVQLDNSEFELNGGRESPLIHSQFFTSSENVGMVDSVPDLLSLDDPAAAGGSNANTFNEPTSRRLDFTPEEFENKSMPLEANITPLTSESVPNLLHWDDVAAEDGPGDDITSNETASQKLDFTFGDSEDNCNPSEANITPLVSNLVPDLLHGDDDVAAEFEDDHNPSEEGKIPLLPSEQIPNPIQENTPTTTSQFSLMNNNLHSIPEEEETTEHWNPNNNTNQVESDSDENGEQIYPEPVEYNEIYEGLLTELDAVGDFASGEHISCLQNTVTDTETDLVPVPNADLVLVPNENPEQTVYNPRRSILQSTSVEEIDAFLNEIPDEYESHRSQKTIAESSEIAGIADLETAFVQVANSLVESEDVGLVDETESGMLVVKANSKEDIELVFKQVGEVTGNNNSSKVPNGGSKEGGDGSEMLVVDAKSISDIDLMMLNASEVSGSGDVGLVDETDSGMLVVKAKNLTDIDAVFKQVGNVLGNTNGEKIENLGIIEDHHSGMMVVDANSISDIESAMLQASEFTGDTEAGLVDETDSGMLVVKATSVEDIRSVFLQVGEVLGNQNVKSGDVDNSGMLVLNAKSVEDIDSAMLQASEPSGNTETGLVDETDSGMLVVKATSVEDIRSVFLQVGEVLGNQNAKSGDVDDSGMLVLNAKSVEDIDSVMKQVSSVTVTEVGDSEAAIEK